MIPASAALRTAFVTLVLGKAVASPTRADPKLDSAPPLTSSSSQFIELSRLVEAPPLELERVDGRFVDLQSLEGKVVLLSFWATWRPPCRRELPMLERLQQVFGDRGVEAIPVSVDQMGKAAVVPFLERIGVRRLRSFLDPEGRIGVRSAEQGSPFVLFGMPINYVIDPRGRPAGYITGEIDWTSEWGLAFLHYDVAFE